MHHQFECESPADAEERASAAIRGAIAAFGMHEGNPLGMNAESVLAEFIVDALVEAGFLPAEPGSAGPFFPVPSRGCSTTAENRAEMAD